MVPQRFVQWRSREMEQIQGLTDKNDVASIAELGTGDVQQVVPNASLRVNEVCLFVYVFTLFSVLMV